MLFANQIFIIFLVLQGNESVALALTYTIFMLAVNPEAQVIYEVFVQFFCVMNNEARITLLERHIRAIQQ